MMILVTILMRVRARLLLEATHDTLGSQAASSVGPSSIGDTIFQDIFFLIDGWLLILLFQSLPTF